MLEDLRRLVRLAERDAPRLRRQVLELTAVGVVAEWCALMSVMDALACQRDGEAPGGEFVVFLLSQGLFYWTMKHARRRLARRFTHVAWSGFEQLVRRLPGMPLLKFVGLAKGDLLGQLLGDAHLVANAGQPLFQFISGTARMLIAVAYCIYLSFFAAVVALGFALLVLAVTAGQMYLVSRGQLTITREEAEMSGLLHEQRLGGTSTRLHAARRRALTDRVRRQSAEVREQRIGQWSRYFSCEYGIEALIYALLGFNVFILPAFASIDVASIGDLNLAILFLLFAVTQPVYSLPPVIQASVAAERLLELERRLDPAQLDQTPAAVGRGRLDGFTRIAAEGLMFRHAPDDDSPGLQVGPISLELRRGELVFVTGPNGSGKTTFTRMLCGLYPAESGGLSVDGRPLDADDLPHLRALFGTIFDAHHIFERVVDGLDPRIEELAAAHLAEMGLTGKTELRGGRITHRRLSTGQQKRLAMVIARLRDRPILLFDEWAAEQDPGFRAYFYRRLLPALRDEGKLVVVVTHDDQFFELADRVIEFDGGRVVRDEVRRCS